MMVYLYTIKRKDMNNSVKQILSENRDSIISSIKWVFKIYKKEDIKEKMIEFLAYCNEYPQTVEDAASDKNTKTLLKYMVQKMSIRQSKKQEEEKNMRLYGQKTISLSELASRYEERQNEKGLYWNPIYKDWTKSPFRQ